MKRISKQTAEFIKLAQQIFIVKASDIDSKELVEFGDSLICVMHIQFPAQLAKLPFRCGSDEILTILDADIDKIIRSIKRLNKDCQIIRPL